MADEYNLEEKCNSFVKDDKENLVNCEKTGIKRYDNGLYAGIHCDDCWNKLIDDARQKSW